KDGMFFVEIEINPGTRSFQPQLRHEHVAHQIEPGQVALIGSPPLRAQAFKQGALAADKIQARTAGNFQRPMICAGQDLNPDRKTGVRGLNKPGQGSNAQVKAGGWSGAKKMGRRNVLNYTLLDPIALIEASFRRASIP